MIDIMDWSQVWKRYNLSHFSLIHNLCVGNTDVSSMEEG